AVAGYTANGTLPTPPIDATAFDIDPDDYPERDAPTGFDDPTFEPPPPLRSVPYVPVVAPVVLPGQPTALAPAWRGTRDNLAASAERVRSSRMNSDSVAVTGDTGTGRGVPRIGLAAPSAAL
ncbi:unnamed protein product, partial [marine sediment metagenome]